MAIYDQGGRRTTQVGPGDPKNLRGWDSVLRHNVGMAGDAGRGGGMFVRFAPAEVRPANVTFEADPQGRGKTVQYLAPSTGNDLAESLYETYFDTFRGNKREGLPTSFAQVTKDLPSVVAAYRAKHPNATDADIQAQVERGVSSLGQVAEASTRAPKVKLFGFLPIKVSQAVNKAASTALTAATFGAGQYLAAGNALGAGGGIASGAQSGVQSGLMASIVRAGAEGITAAGGVPSSSGLLTSQWLAPGLVAAESAVPSLAAGFGAGIVAPSISGAGGTGASGAGGGGSSGLSLPSLSSSDLALGALSGISSAGTITGLASTSPGPPSALGQTLPLEPTLETAQAAVNARETEQARKRSRAVTTTVLNSPLGLNTRPSVQRSVLTALGG